MALRRCSAVGVDAWGLLGWGVKACLDGNDGAVGIPMYPLVVVASADVVEYGAAMYGASEKSQNSKGFEGRGVQDKKGLMMTASLL